MQDFNLIKEKEAKIARFFNMGKEKEARLVLKNLRMEDH